MHINKHVYKRDTFMYTYFDESGKLMLLAHFKAWLDFLLTFLLGESRHDDKMDNKSDSQKSHCLG